MLPTKGYFETCICPFFLSGFCYRPHCHFRHFIEGVPSEEILLKEIIRDENKALYEKQLRDLLISSFANCKAVTDNLLEKSGEERSCVPGAVAVSYKATPTEELQRKNIFNLKSPDPHSREITAKDDTNSKTHNSTEPVNLSHINPFDYGSLLPMVKSLPLNLKPDNHVVNKSLNEADSLESKTVSLENESLPVKMKDNVQNLHSNPCVIDSEGIATDLNSKSHKNKEESRPRSKSNKVNEKGDKNCLEDVRKHKEITDNSLGKCKKIKKPEENLKYVKRLNTHSGTKSKLSEINRIKSNLKTKKEKLHKKERSDKKLKEKIKSKEINSKRNHDKLKKKEAELEKYCGLNNNSMSKCIESKSKEDNSIEDLLKLKKEKRLKNEKSDNKLKEKINSKEINLEGNHEKLNTKKESLENICDLNNQSMPILTTGNEKNSKENISSRINKRMENTCDSETITVVSSDSEPEINLQENRKLNKRSTQSEILFPLFSSYKESDEIPTESDDENKYSNNNKISLLNKPSTASKVEDEDFLLDHRVQSNKRKRVSLGNIWRPPPKKLVEIMTPAKRLMLFRQMKEDNKSMP